MQIVKGERCTLTRCPYTQIVAHGEEFAALEFTLRGRVAVQLNLDRAFAFVLRSVIEVHYEYSRGVLKVVHHNIPRIQIVVLNASLMNGDKNFYQLSPVGGSFLKSRAKDA